MSSLLLVKSPWSEWKIETVLGKGSFGTVYRAVRTEGENRYYSAIKHISIPDSQQEIDNAVKSGVNSDTDSLNQFFEGIANTYINEIKTMYQLRGNTNIVLYEDHKMHRKENGVGFDIYIRMELLQPITEYWKNRTPQDTEIARLGADICTAVSLCCAKGIIHRDIKPSNIYVSDSGSFKLGDFGSSVLYRDIKNGNTISGATPAYLAPELSLGKSTFSEQTDIYALGLVLYRLLNNDLLPFMSAENINNQEYAELAIVRRNSGERIPAPANGNPALNSVILKSVEFLPENRYKSAEEFKKALMNYGSGNTVTPNYTPLDATERANAVSYSGINQTPFAHYEQPVFNSPNYTTPSYHSQNIYPSSVPTAQEQATAKSKTMNLTIICATVCILAAIIAIVLILNKDNTTESNNNADSSISSSESVSTASNYNTTSMSCLETAEEQKNASADNDVEPDPSNIIPVKKVSCSSHAGNGKYGRKYGADMAIDGKPQTCWMAYGTPAGKGNWIKLDFGKKTTITGIKLINGNTWNGVYKGSFIDGYDKLYEKNGRLHAFTAEISDGWTFTGIAYDVNETEYETNIFYFDTPVETSYIKLYVVSGYKGYKYKNNVCIGEIQAFC